jgi:oligopeptide/dipeptide ABC transporter ATP-binding protein
MPEETPLLSVQNLKTYFYTFEGVAAAVDDVSFELRKGETLCVVGESGSGKSVTALSVMGLIPSPPGRVLAGSIRFQGEDLLQYSESRMSDVRGNRISMIFQEPMTSLNPLFKIGDQLSESFIRHKGMSKTKAWHASIEMLSKVQIPSPARRAREYPHQMSGGMRQRVMIAMALACDPEILIADEPTTALDVTIQAQVLDLMRELKSNFDAAVILITHDLGVVAQMATRVVVMYAGKVVETGSVLNIFEDPKHPYTESLLRSIPRMGRRIQEQRSRLQEIPGMVPSLYELPAGCSFFNRCEKATAACKQTPVPLTDLGRGRQVRCLLYG